MRAVPNSAESPVCFLFDNGSLRAASTLNLRVVARALAKAIDAPVHAVSLLHSSAVAAAELDGEPARLLEPALTQWLTENPRGAAVALPFFFGPSGALTQYVPPRLHALAENFSDSQLVLAEWLVDPAEPDVRIAEALVSKVREAVRKDRLVRPSVVLVDHGSPQRAVAEVRDFLGRQVRALLGDEIADFSVASMERREGEAFAFNEPLLATRLRTAPFDAGDVVVALQFLSPGRHAGAAGDIEEICTRAEVERPALRTWITDTLGADVRVIEVLAGRYREAIARLEG